MLKNSAETGYITGLHDILSQYDTEKPVRSRWDDWMLRFRGICLKLLKAVVEIGAIFIDESEIKHD